MKKLILTKEIVMEIPALVLSGMMWRDISKKTGISKSTISRLRLGQLHREWQEELNSRIDAAERALKIPAGTRRCTKCKGVFPETVEYFNYTAANTNRFATFCKKCNSNRMRVRYRNAQDIVFKYYGGDKPSCACCGECRREFLSIDHINGGGTAHKKSLKKKYSSWCFWLIQAGFPKEFRLLCMNCNSSLGFHGYCPHEREKSIN
jgi:hypothetical protein